MHNYKGDSIFSVKGNKILGSKRPDFYYYLTTSTAVFALNSRLFCRFSPHSVKWAVKGKKPYRILHLLKIEKGKKL